MEYLQAVTLVNMDVLEYIGASSYKAVSGIRAKAPPTRLSVSHPPLLVGALEMVSDLGVAIVWSLLLVPTEQTQAHFYC